jgi:hypothetical protein
VKLTTHLHLVPRSRMCGAIPPLPQYAFMAWCSVKSTGTTLCRVLICVTWLTHLILLGTIFVILYEDRSRDRSMVISLGYGLDERGSDSQQRLGIFLSITMFRRAVGPIHPPSSPVCTRGSFLGLNWPGRKADHSLPSTAEVEE